MMLKRFFAITFSMWGIYRYGKKLARGKVSKQAFGLYVKNRLGVLGATFIKFGQILSLRPDLVPVELCLPLRDLLDNAPVMPSETVRLILSKELKADSDEVFVNFNIEPIASASLAQVHEATLRSTGELVAVKIKKAGIEKLMRSDMRILRLINIVLYPFIKDKINSRTIISDLEMLLSKESDFLNEGFNSERFGANFKKLTYVKVPLIYWQYSTKNMLVMEYITGVSLNRVLRVIDDAPELLEKNKFEVDGIIIDKQKLVRRMTEITAHSVFKLGFFHADPHPANIILLPDNVIAYIDFGMVGDLLNEERSLFSEVVFCISTGNEDRLFQLWARYNQRLGYEAPPSTKALQIRRALHNLIFEYRAANQKNFPIANFMYEVSALAFRYRFPPPPFLMLVIKQIFTLEGMTAYFDPHIRVLESFQPYVIAFRKAEALQNLNGEHMLKLVSDLATLGYALPETFTSLLQKFSNNDAPMVASKRSRGARPLFAVLMVLLIVIASVISTEHLITGLLLALSWTCIISTVVISYFIIHSYDNNRD